MKNRLISWLLLSLLPITINYPIFANENLKHSETERYSTRIAYVKNVNETGTNIKECEVETFESSIDIEINRDNSITIDAIVNNEEVTITGMPKGRTNSGNTVFFDSQVSNSKYEIVNFSYSADISSVNTYFQDVRKTESSDTVSVLKIYLRDRKIDSRDYYIIETFAVDLGYENAFIARLQIDPLLGAWVVTQFQPVSSDFWEEDETSAKGSSVKTWYCVKTFYDVSEYTTHTISWRTTADCTDVEVGGDALQSYFVTIYAKSMSFEITTDFNSSTSSFLCIDGVDLQQVSIPNTAWKSVKIDGNVQNSSIFAGELSANISFAWGILNLSFNIPTSFIFQTNIDIDDTYNSFENNVNGQFVRGIETEMDSHHRLNQIGNRFSVDTILRDYGGEVRNAELLQAIWHVQVMNFATFNTYAYTCQHNSYVSITE